MRTEVLLALVAGSSSPWAPVNFHQKNFQVSLFGAYEAGASGTWKVQHTFDDPNLQPPRQPLSLTRAAAVATVVDPGHGLSTGDCVITFSTGDPNLDNYLVGGSDVTVIDVNTYTYAVANTGALVGLPGSRAITLRVQDHAQMTGLVARTDGNYAFPVRACRARCTVTGAGNLRLVVTQGQGGMGG